MPLWVRLGNTRVRQGRLLTYVFLSADDKAPADTAKAGFALADTEFTYAIGRLVLWSDDP